MSGPYKDGGEDQKKTRAVSTEPCEPIGGRPSNAKNTYRHDVTSCEHRGQQHVTALSAVGGFADISLAAGLTDRAAPAPVASTIMRHTNDTALGGNLLHRQALNARARQTMDASMSHSVEDERIGR
jgi:hypothetical protein